MLTFKDIIAILKDNPKETIKDFAGALAVIAGCFALGLVFMIFA